MWLVKARRMGRVILESVIIVVRNGGQSSTPRDNAFLAGEDNCATEIQEARTRTQCVVARNNTRPECAGMVYFVT